MRVPSFREIGNNLKERFDKASRVRVDNNFRGVSRNKYKYKKSVQLETYEPGERKRVLLNVSKCNLCLSVFH